MNQTENVYIGRGQTMVCMHFIKEIMLKLLLHFCIHSVNASCILKLENTVGRRIER